MRKIYAAQLRRVLAAASSLLRHPQDLLSPDLKLSPRTMRRVPQVHSHPHKAFPFEANPVWCITVQRPNRCPVRSMNRKLGLTIGVPFHTGGQGAVGR
jgi:hypothetical protein